MRRLATATSIIAAFLLVGSAARADIMVCNDFHAPIHVAFASQDKGHFNAAGWWTVAPKACHAVDFAFRGGRAVLHGGFRQLPRWERDQ